MPLFIVSTPIGNLQDLTPRAIKTLENANLILAEDTRTTASLLEKFSISGKKIVNYTDRTLEQEFLPWLEAALNQNVCLVSDAGTPAISDPGYKLIKKAHEMGILVSPIIGASSVIGAISISGLPSYNFAFLGFYEKTKLPMAKLLLKQSISCVFFLPARDIIKILQEISTLTNIKLSIARELTKMFEDIKTGTLQELQEHYSNPQKLKGEAVLTIAPVKPLAMERQDLALLIQEKLQEKPFLKELSKKELSLVLKNYEEEFESFSKKQIYNELLKL